MWKRFWQLCTWAGGIVLIGCRISYGNNCLCSSDSSVDACAICCTVLGVVSLQFVSQWAAKWSGTDLREMYERRRQNSPPFSPPSSPPPFFFFLSSLLCISLSWLASCPYGRGNKSQNVASYNTAGHMRDSGHKLHTPFFFGFSVNVSVRAGAKRREFLKASTSSQCVSGWPVAFCSPLENHKCKRFPVTAFIIALVTESGSLQTPLTQKAARFLAAYCCIQPNHNSVKTKCYLNDNTSSSKII